MISEDFSMPASEQLRSIINASGKTQVEIERDTGIPQPKISSFMSGRRGLRLVDFDKLTDYFGLELQPAAPKKPAKKAKGK